MMPWRPIACNYFVTLRCDSTCEYCEIWRKEDFKNIEEAPIERIIRNLEDLKTLGVHYIDFTGGEPLLRHDLPQILKASKRLGFHNTITTSGALFKDRAFEIAPFLDTVLFSIDSPFADEHDRIRGTYSYEGAIEGIKTAKKHKKNAIINFTLTRDSILVLPDMVELAEKLNVLLWINPVYRYGGAEGFEKRSLGYIKRYQGRKNVAFNMASLDLIERGGNDVRRPACKAVNSVVTILPDDRLIFPCFYKQDFSVKIDGKLRQLYRSGSIAEHKRKQGRFEECRGCLAWPYMNPSFLYALNKRFFMAVMSLGYLLWKEHKIRKEN